MPTVEERECDNSITSKTKNKTIIVEMSKLKATNIKTEVKSPNMVTKVKSAQFMKKVKSFKLQTLRGPSDPRSGKERFRQQDLTHKVVKPIIVDQMSWSNVRGDSVAETSWDAISGPQMPITERWAQVAGDNLCGKRVLPSSFSTQFDCPYTQTSNAPLQSCE